MSAHAWNGAAVKCDCGSTNVKYEKDVDHDGGSCEIFRCLDCRKRIHVELPDG